MERINLVSSSLRQVEMSGSGLFLSFQMGEITEVTVLCLRLWYSGPSGVELMCWISF